MIIIYKDFVPTDLPTDDEYPINEAWLNNFAQSLGFSGVSVRRLSSYGGSVFSGYLTYYDGVHYLYCSNWAFRFNSAEEKYIKWKTHGSGDSLTTLPNKFLYFEVTGGHSAKIDEEYIDLHSTYFDGLPLNEIAIGTVSDNLYRYRQQNLLIPASLEPSTDFNKDETARTLIQSQIGALKDSSYIKLPNYAINNKSIYGITWETQPDYPDNNGFYTSENNPPSHRYDWNLTQLGCPVTGNFTYWTNLSISCQYDSDNAFNVFRLSDGSVHEIKWKDDDTKNIFILVNTYNRARYLNLDGQMSYISSSNYAAEVFLDWSWPCITKYYYIDLDEIRARALAGYSTTSLISFNTISNYLHEVTNEQTLTWLNSRTSSHVLGYTNNQSFSISDVRVSYLSNNVTTYLQDFFETRSFNIAKYQYIFSSILLAQYLLPAWVTSSTLYSEIAHIGYDSRQTATYSGTTPDIKYMRLLLPGNNDNFVWGSRITGGTYMLGNTDNRLCNWEKNQSNFEYFVSHLYTDYFFTYDQGANYIEGPSWTTPVINQNSSNCLRNNHTVIPNYTITNPSLYTNTMSSADFYITNDKKIIMPFSYTVGTDPIKGFWNRNNYYHYGRTMYLGYNTRSGTYSGQSLFINYHDSQQIGEIWTFRFTNTSDIRTSTFNLSYDVLICSKTKPDILPPIGVPDTAILLATAGIRFYNNNDFAVTLKTYKNYEEVTLGTISSRGNIHIQYGTATSQLATGTHYTVWYEGNNYKSQKVKIYTDILF